MEAKKKATVRIDDQQRKYSSKSTSNVTGQTGGSVLRNASGPRLLLLKTDFLEGKRHPRGQKLSYTRDPVAQFIHGSTMP